MPTERHLSREEEERLWMWSICPLIPVLVCVIAYFAHLKSIGAIPSFQLYVSYGILALLSFLGMGAGIYEVVSSFKMKRSFSFRVKRFLLRMALASGFVTCLYAMWVFITFILSPVVTDRLTLVLSLFTTSLAMAVLLRHPKTRPLVKRLTQEDSQ